MKKMRNLNIFSQKDSIVKRYFYIEQRPLQFIQSFPFYLNTNNYINKNSQKMNQLYQRAWRGIISPNKFTHQIASHCPRQQIIQGRVLQRIDFSIKNHQKKQLSAVILKQENKDPDTTILYMHGNGGSKLECLGFIPLICKNNIAVIGFDFVGCGNSDTGFLTYGINQSKDAETILEEAKKYLKIKKLAIWGRSMGAATAIILAQKRKLPIDSLILDSPFQNLLSVIQRVIKNQTQMPKGLCFLASYLLSQQINRKLSIELFGMNYLQIYCKICKFIPTLLFYSQNDVIVPKQEVFQFYNVCKTHKQLVQIFQQHQQERSLSVFDQGVQFLKKLPQKKTNKLKLSYMTDGLQIDNTTIKTGRGLCCCTNL